MVTPGRYDHFKGGTYRVLLLTVDAETLERRVIYTAIGKYTEEDPQGRTWDRLEHEFQQTVEWPDGEKKARFVRVGD